MAILKPQKLLPFLFLLLPFLGTAQQLHRIHPNAYFLINCSDSGRKVLLSDNGEIHLLFHNHLDDDKLEYRDIDLSGKLNEINDSSLHFRLFEESIHLIYGDGTISDYHKNFHLGQDSTLPEIRTIKLSELQYLQYNSPFKSSLNDATSPILALSTITALLVAPLVSIKYKNGQFNSNRYYKWAAGGLIGVSVSIPVVLLTRPKKYLIGIKKDEMPSQFWYIKPEPARQAVWVKAKHKRHQAKANAK